MDTSHESPVSNFVSTATPKPVKRACDQCKLRKIKCSLEQPCSTCVARNFDCTYQKPQRKRGPPGKRLLQIQQQQTHLPSEDHVTRNMETPSSSHSRRLSGSSDAASSQSQSLMASSDWTPLRSLTDPMPEDLQGSGAMNTAYVVGFPVTNVEGILTFNDQHDAEYWPPDSVSSQVSSFYLSGSNHFVDSALPPIIEPNFEGVGDAIPHTSPPQLPMYNLSIPQDGYEATVHLWPSYISEVSLIPWIDVYFDRLHPTLPVLNRSSLMTRILHREHHQNPLFGSMLLSLCAFAITQPIFINERSTSSTRASQAKQLMNEAVKMRSSSDFGENPELEAVLTSFFLFGCLFGSNQHNAAWLRLREAIDLALTMGLNNPDSYGVLSNEEKGRRLRVYLVLSITERAYAIQRQHPINFRLIPGFDEPFSDDLIHNSTNGLPSGVVVYNEKDAGALMGLSLLMELFSVINEDDVDCWNAICGVTQGRCNKASERKVLALHDQLSRVDLHRRFRNYDRINLDGLRESDHTGSIPASFASQFLISQYADILITQKWLQHRVWQLCLTHNLLKAESYRPELHFYYAISLAESTLAICLSLSLSSMEAHGIGLIEKLYHIAATAVTVLYNPMFSVGPTANTSSGRQLSDKFLKILSSLRGGNHPYLEKYKAHLNSFEAGWPENVRRQTTHSLEAS